MIRSSDSSAKNKRFDINRQRNHPSIGMVDVLIEFALDNSQDIDLRIMTVETLSWYTHSVKRQLIIEACNKIIQANENVHLVNEAVKTVNRLK